MKIKGYNFSVFELAFFIALLFGLHSQQSWAVIHGAHGLMYNVSKQYTLCGSQTSADKSGVKFVGNFCDLTVVQSAYVPHSGNYKVAITYWGEVAMTTSAYFDESISVNAQNVTVSGKDSKVFYPWTDQNFDTCYFLVDESGTLHGITLANVSRASSCDAIAPPLPPTPPQPPTSCTVNNGNALSVSLGTLDRADLPTIADSGTAKNMPFNVSCTGADVTVSMKLSYSSMPLGSSQAVKTSANGVGVAILYDGKPLSTTDTTSVIFLKGANTMNLGFEAVRDLTVDLKDIPTGAFTASAVLEMTQQ